MGPNRERPVFAIGNLIRVRRETPGEAFLRVTSDPDVRDALRSRSDIIDLDEMIETELPPVEPGLVIELRGKRIFPRLTTNSVPTLEQTRTEVAHSTPEK